MSDACPCGFAMRHCGGCGRGTPRAVYAATYGVSKGAIAKLQRQGAPLDEPDQMGDFVAAARGMSAPAAAADRVTMLREIWRRLGGNVR